MRTAAACTLSLIVSVLPSHSQAGQDRLTAAEKKAVDSYFDDKIAELNAQREQALLWARSKTPSQIAKVYPTKSDTGSGVGSKEAVKENPTVQFGQIGSKLDACGYLAGVYVRRDRLDTFQLRGSGVSVSDAKGASLSFSDNIRGNTNALTINGRAGAFLVGPDPEAPCVDGRTGDPYAPWDPNVPHAGFGIAPFVDAQGTANNPKQKTESSALSFGVDLQASVYGGTVFDFQYIVLSPYHQTDFRDQASVNGMQFGWEPILTKYRLGGRIEPASEYVDYYFQLRAEADLKDVRETGYTRLARGEYRWIGLTGQIHVDLFPDMSVESEAQPPFPWLVGKLFANGKIQYYYDERSGRAIDLYETEMGFNLTPDGKSSVSFRYDNGRDKDTLVGMRKYLLTLNYKY